MVADTIFFESPSKAPLKIRLGCNIDLMALTVIRPKKGCIKIKEFVSLFWKVLYIKGAFELANGPF